MIKSARIRTLIPLFNGLHGHVLLETQLSFELYKSSMYSIFLVRCVLGCKGLCKTIDKGMNVMQLIMINILARQGG